jgi:hypothetical protein
MQISCNQKEMTDDQTFDNLRRVPFWKVLTYVAESLDMQGREKDFCRWIATDNSYANGPNEEWLAEYQKMGWTWKELVDEAILRQKEIE